jgi:histidinol-phosphate aminotransferase
MSLRLHGDTVARPGMLDFAVNVWPGQRSEALQAALLGALADGASYPDERGARLAIAARHGCSPDEVLLTNGACEAFWLLAQALRPKTVAVIHPSFSEPEFALRRSGSQVLQLFREPANWRLSGAAIPEDVECVVLANPNNPTGTLEPTATLAALAREGRLLVLDESFIDFVPAADATLAGDRDLPGLVVVRSLTKLWSLAGIRAGYLLASAELVETLAAHRQPWSVNSLACAALATCASDRQTPRRLAAEVAAARSASYRASASGPRRRTSCWRAWPTAPPLWQRSPRAASPSAPPPHSPAWTSATSASRCARPMTTQCSSTL